MTYLCNIVKIWSDILSRREQIERRGVEQWKRGLDFASLSRQCRCLLLDAENYIAEFNISDNTSDDGIRRVDYRGRGEYLPGSF